MEWFIHGCGTQECCLSTEVEDEHLYVDVDGPRDTFGNCRMPVTLEVIAFLATKLAEHQARGGK